MEHVVFFSQDSGQSEFRRVGDLESAVRLVESLRNERGIADVSVHALTPVPVSFRTYYRVEVAGADLSSAASPEATARPVEPVEPVGEGPPRGGGGGRASRSSRPLPRRSRLRRSKRRRSKRRRSRSRPLSRRRSR